MKQTWTTKRRSQMAAAFCNAVLSLESAYHDALGEELLKEGIEKQDGCGGNNDQRILDGIGILGQFAEVRDGCAQV